MAEAPSVCPIMSYGGSVVACVKEKCMMWDKSYVGCVFFTQVERVCRTIDSLTDIQRDIRSKM